MTSATGIDWTSEPDLDRLRRARAMLATKPGPAIIELSALAGRGSIMSMVYLGEVYANGEIAQLDLEEAEKWYRRAADSGSVRAQYYLGRLYGRLNRFQEAERALRCASDFDFHPALHSLGLMYLFWTGVPKDVARSKQLLARASSLGNVPARGALAWILMKHCRGTVAKLKGGWLYISAFLMGITVICTEGWNSDRMH